MAMKPLLLWFRHDLRLADNRALAAAASRDQPVVPVYVLDDAAPGRWAPGAASRWWLHGSLASLAHDLSDLGAPLILRRGRSEDVLAHLAAETGAAAVHCSRAYEPWASDLEGRVQRALQEAGVAFRRAPGSLLAEPERIATAEGRPFRVFTPFWRALRHNVEVAQPVGRPVALRSPRRKVASDRLDDWRLLPAKPDWAGGLREAWRPGEQGAQARLAEFLETGLASYHAMRNRPDTDGSSRLSPHLHFGEVSPAQCWHAAVHRCGGSTGGDRGLETFLSELGWRDFSAHLLFHWPSLPEAPFRPEFDRFPWRKDAEGLAAWQRGRTGYPIVDAGMRQLWTMGWMHNRVRMIVASFLVKDLLVPWQDGESWFWDTLVDADLANNAASWQWVAGSGADAAPYFRIFNPVKQGQTFDPEGAYVRRWVPELASLGSDHIHAPWLAPESVLASANIRLGKTYPLPLVDHAAARTRALEAYERVKADTQSYAGRAT